VCSATPLWRLVDVLNEAYGVNIIIGNPRLKNLELTTTFRNEPIENILAVVSETLNIHVERKGIDIILK
jgi:ferric-dicitrate binding protein FerR (iron transport regulator)